MFAYTNLDRHNLGVKTYYRLRPNWFLISAALGCLAFWGGVACLVVRVVAK